jgi:hypothetical protein
MKKGLSDAFLHSFLLAFANHLQHLSSFTTILNTIIFNNNTRRQLYISDWDGFYFLFILSLLKKKFHDLHFFSRGIYKTETSYIKKKKKTILYQEKKQLQYTIHSP